MMDDWPDSLSCPVCGQDVTASQLSEEFDKHKRRRKSLDRDIFILAAEQNRTL